MEEEEWYTQAVDAAEEAYMKQKAAEAEAPLTSRSNKVVVEDWSSSDEELLPDYVSDVER